MKDAKSTRQNKSMMSDTSPERKSLTARKDMFHKVNDGLHNYQGNVTNIYEQDER